MMFWTEINDLSVLKVLEKVVAAGDYRATFDPSMLIGADHHTLTKLVDFNDSCGYSEDVDSYLFAKKGRKLRENLESRYAKT